ncbi:MAG: TonB-dependent receptor plug domain-containing protein [Bacteroidales bacterium]
MRRYLFLAFLLPCLRLSGQADIGADTIRLGEVVVKGSLLSSVADAFSEFRVDSVVLAGSKLQSIADIVNSTGTMYLKTYGPGGIATSSYRGAGASHTQLSWNGISINSPMLGQADLSLIPGGFADRVNIYTGLASLAIGSGGLGSTIDVGNITDWNDNEVAEFSGGMASFSEYSTYGKLNLGNTNFRSSTRYSLSTALNNFRFIDEVSSSSSFTARRQYASTNREAFLQEFYLRNGNSVTTARLWYQNSFRKIPAPLLVSQTVPPENQTDIFLRSMIDHKRYFGRSDLAITLALFSDKLNYRNDAASIDSRNHSLSFFSKASFSARAGRTTSIEFTLDNELNRVNSVNYASVITRNTSHLTVSSHHALAKNMNLVLILREMLHDGEFLVPDFSAGFEYKPSIRLNPGLLLNISRNSRVPGLNDLYWNPGGNKDLNNEYSLSFEVAGGLSIPFSERLSIEPRISVYSNSITDLIQWLPGPFSYWMPVNLSKVNTSGLESFVTASYSFGKQVLKLDAHYTYSRACETGNTDADNKGKQLVYVPVNQAGGSARLTSGKLNLNISADYTGKRYTMADNSKALDGFLLTDVSVGAKVKAGRHCFDFSIMVDNLFNVNYQAVVNQPMPLRSFGVSVTMHLMK